MHDTLAMIDGVSRIEVGSGSSAADTAFDAGAAAATASLASIKQHTLSAVIVYTSSRYDAAEVLRGVHSIVGDVTVFGATTAGEICNRRQTETVTVVALASPHL